MSRYVLSVRARRDLIEIWEWTAGRWDEQQADAYIVRLNEHFEAIASNPAIGRPCPELRRGYFKYVAASHQLFYRRYDSGIEIVRIPHVRLDPSRHL